MSCAECLKGRRQPVAGASAVWAPWECNSARPLIDICGHLLEARTRNLLGACMMSMRGFPRAQRASTDSPEPPGTSSGIRAPTNRSGERRSDTTPASTMITFHSSLSCGRSAATSSSPFPWRMQQSATSARTFHCSWLWLSLDRRRRDLRCDMEKPQVGMRFV